jgi:uncharacterized protein YdaU (DUF1376 family)
MSRIHWMKFYPGDYLRDTMHLATEEHGAYLLILMAAWTSGGVVEEQNLPNISLLGVKKWNQVAPKISPFFTVENGKWTHPRVQRELLKADEAHIKQVESGKRGAEIRWEPDRVPNGDPNGVPSRVSIAYQIPDTRSQIPDPKKKESKSIYSSDFDFFWKDYPLKQNKKTAMKSYEKVRRDGVSAETLIKAVENAKRQSDKWREGYVPMASTWLNQERWTDEFTAPRGGTYGPSVDPLINDILAAAHIGIKRQDWSGVHAVGMRALKAMGGRSVAENLKTSELSTWRAQFRKAVEAELKTGAN